MECYFTFTFDIYYFKYGYTNFSSTNKLVLHFYIKGDVK